MDGYVPNVQSSHRCEQLLREMHPALRDMYSNKEFLRQRYRIVDILGLGGFAAVFRCVDTITQNKVAAKVSVDFEMNADGTCTDKEAQDFSVTMKHEYGIYKRLKAGRTGPLPGIPNVYSAATKKAVHPEHSHKMCCISYIVMELLGPSVSRLSLEQQTYKSNRSLLVNHGLNMLKALRCMHECGLVHSDVKPENFCLPYGYDVSNPSSADRVYIVDMGMALDWYNKGFSWDQQSYRYSGTVDYSSVRALKGFHPTPKDDLESLACALLEMAAGETPFDLLHISEDGKPVQQKRLQEAAEQKDREWTHILHRDDTPDFIKQWMRHLRSMPTQHVPTDQDYQMFSSILVSAIPQADSAEPSAWSSAFPVRQNALGQKRAAPEPSAASNMHSCISDTATAVQSKRFKHEEATEEEDEYSMACCVLSASPDE